LKTHRFEIVLAASLAAMVAAVFLWQNPGVYKGKINAGEIDSYMGRIEKLPFPAEERAELLKRTHSWLEHDDGKPVYMLNLMRFYPQLRQFPGALPFAGTPRESNATYEQHVMPMLFQAGGYPAYAGNSLNGNLMEYAPELDNWDRVLVVRYPDRRAFMNLVTREDYRQWEPYKIMALKVVLTPTEVEMNIPDLTLVAGALALLVLCLTGWWRAARRSLLVN